MNLKNYSSAVTSFATCWHIELKNGRSYRFIEHEDDIDIGLDTYKSVFQFERSAIEISSDSNVSNLCINGIINHNSIKHEDLVAGLFDFAKVSVFLIDVNDPLKQLYLRTGWFGEVTIYDNNFVVEIKGLADVYDQKIGELYSNLCRAQLGDSKCRVDLSHLIKQMQIKRVINHNNIILNDLDVKGAYYKHGKVKFLSGKNIGLSANILEQIGNKLELTNILPYIPEKCDYLEITPGCDKSVTTCKNKFSNVINFRAEPFINKVAKNLF